MISRFFANLVVALVQSLSRAGRRRLANALADAAYFLGIRRGVALDNLRHAFPERDAAEHRRIARGVYRTMTFSLIEAIAGVRYTDAELAAVVQATGWEKVEAALAGGKGVIMATGHFGSWELLGEVVCRRGTKISVVAKPLKGALNEHIIRARTEAGVSLVHPKGSVVECAKALERNEMVCLLIDQSIAANRGVFVPFFGRPASTTPAAALVARRSGSPVLVGMAHWEGEVLKLEVEGPFPVPQTGDEQADLTAHTAAVTAVIEKHIRAHPEQWLWVHRRWKERPPAAPAADQPALTPPKSAAG